MKNTAINCCSSAASHPGNVRSSNQDAYLESPAVGIWAVADGMGGHAAGEIASKLIIEALMRIDQSKDITHLTQQTRDQLNNANRELRSISNDYPESRAPGSTVAVLLLDNARAAVLWAGDSRVYRLRDGKLKLLTHDHSHVQELVDSRIITQADAEVHPMANYITRAVGLSENLELDMYQFSTRNDDRYLLCSDGLTRVLDKSDITNTMQTGKNPDIVNSLLQTTLERGAPDNVTVVSVICR